MSVIHMLFPQVDHGMAEGKLWLEPGKVSAVGTLPVMLQTVRQDESSRMIFNVHHNKQDYSVMTSKLGWFCLPFERYPVVAPRAVEYSECGRVLRVLVEVLYPFTEVSRTGGGCELSGL